MGGWVPVLKEEGIEGAGYSYDRGFGEIPHEGIWYVCYEEDERGRIAVVQEWGGGRRVDYRGLYLFFPPVVVGVDS